MTASGGEAEGNDVRDNLKQKREREDVRKYRRDLEITHWSCRPASYMENIDDTAMKGKI